MPAPKTTFLLKDIDIDDISERYGFTSETAVNVEIPENVTEISLDPVLDYQDPSRREKTAVVTFVDYVGKILPERTNIHCEWCRHPFDSVPLGVPVKYVPSEAIKRYKADTITRLTVETITESRQKELRDEYGVVSIFTQDPDEFSYSTLLLKNGYYLSDSIVCSYDCMLAFIQVNSHDSLYTHSRMLANRIIRDTHGPDVTIHPAGSYRLLEAYGGPLSIEKFREEFSTVNYTDLRNPIFEHPTQKALGWLHRREIQF